MKPTISQRIVLSALIGLLPGFFSGLLGIGGGIIIIPLMVKIMGLRQQQAHGNSLVAQVFIATTASIAYAIEGSIDVVAALIIATTAVIAARYGAHYAHAMPERKLKRFLGAFITVVSASLLFKSVLIEQTVEVILPLKIAYLAITGVFTGFLSGMLGVGGAIIMIPAMVLMLGLDQHTAQGSALLVMVPVGIAGSLAHWKLGNIEKSVLPGLVPSLMIGTYIGTVLAHMLTGSTLQSIFVIVLMVMGLRYLVAPMGKVA